jgi:NAD(P)-dependent dehydrogenase (short-subunit alcohol dehydrogenase family)
MNVVITGAGRGIGLGFVKHYLNQGANVWACYRSDRSRLDDLDSGGLKAVHWDICEDKNAEQPSGVSFPDTIDLLINNAGIYGPDKENGQSLENINPEAMRDVMEVNCFGPLRVVQHLKSRIIAATGKIANISSKMGSVEDNTSGGCYAYRASKACLVSVSKSMAIDLAPFDVRVITLHPGWVKTDMTRHNGLIDVETSVNGMAGVIDDIDNYSPGEFVAFDGRRIPY